MSLPPGAKHQLESVPSTLHPCPVLDTGSAQASGFPKEAMQKPSPHDCMSGLWCLILSTRQTPGHLVVKTQDRPVKGLLHEGNGDRKLYTAWAVLCGCSPGLNTEEKAPDWAKCLLHT